MRFSASEGWLDETEQEINVQHRIFHQSIFIRATGACLLTATLGTANWLDIKTASALPIKLIQIRPMTPEFKAIPVVAEHGLPPRTGVSPNLSGIKPPPATALDDIHLMPDGRRLPTLLELIGSKAVAPPPGMGTSRFRFVENEPVPWMRSPRAPTTPRSASLDDWYAPAADVAQNRSPTENFVAERTMGEYKSTVGSPAILHDAGRPWPSQKEVHDAEQLAVRLILAVLEDTPTPSVFGPPSAIAEVEQKLLHSLNNTASLGVRPVGTRVWGDLLNQEYLPDAYQWRGRVVGSNKAGEIDFRVDSWLLPTTVTTIDVGSYATTAVQSQMASMRNLADLLKSSRPKGSFLDEFRTK